MVRFFSSRTLTNHYTHPIFWSEAMRQLPRMLSRLGLESHTILGRNLCTLSHSTTREPLQALPQMMGILKKKKKKPRWQMPTNTVLTCILSLVVIPETLCQMCCLLYCLSSPSSSILMYIHVCTSTIHDTSEPGFLFHSPPIFESGCLTESGAQRTLS